MEPTTFILTYRPARPDFLAGMTEIEAGIVSRHFGYLEALQKEGKLVIAGRCEDATFGIAVLKLRSLAEAKRILEEDPAVRAKVFLGELKEFRIALTSTPGNC